MYGLGTIMRMNAQRAADERRMTPPPIPREKRRLGWFTDNALANLKDELYRQKAGPGAETGRLLAACERELDYRRREARIIQAAREKAS